MNILSKAPSKQDEDDLAPATPRELVLEHAVLLRKSGRHLSAIHWSMVVTGVEECDRSVYQGLIKSTSESLEITATNLEELADRAKRTPMGMPAWRFILQMGATLGVALVVMAGILLGAAWLIGGEPERPTRFGDQERMSASAPRLGVGESKP